MAYARVSKCGQYRPTTHALWWTESGRLSHVRSMPHSLWRLRQKRAWGPQAAASHALADCDRLKSNESLWLAPAGWDRRKR